MRKVVSFLDRLLPALLMASSVTLLTAGLLSYAPSAFGDWRTPEPELGGGDPLLTLPPSSTPVDLTPSPSPTLDPNATPVPSDGPPTQSPGTTPSPGAFGPATRIRIPSLDIDLPVIPGDLVVPGNVDFYPLCDVAMFMREYVEPGEVGTTYVYAHAQRGMFAPLLKASLVDNGASMIGALIEVYTSDNKLHLYELTLVKRHATDLSLADAPPGEHQLVLQTSEGVSGTIPKLQVLARPLTVVPAGPAEANPRPRPRVCLPH
jgi:sortase family protein